MSSITLTSRAARAARRGAAQRATTGISDDESEFQGFWLNVGIRMPNGSFARLNRGIAIDDLFTRKVYESTDAEYGKEIAVTNKAVTILKRLATAKKMGEGESIPLPNLEVVLYRKQEGSEMDGDAMDLAEMEAFLLGTNSDADEDEIPAPKAKAKVNFTRSTQVEPDDADDDMLSRKVR
jgi:hypothetical protein